MTEAAKEDQVKWTNLYTGQYYESPVALIYGIWAVPENFLLDSSGKIISKGIEILEIDGEIYVSDRKAKTIKKFIELITQ